ncbi:hypothetical protein BX659_1543 [Orenia metallireducens]|uniref:Uncharacterized protein n=1 Tax=Orenia metallireducens TaxID=1413210 RepID=A0A285IKD6_9FIRM|nr:hypothetical protein [Orenia metallireducens]PRX17219.1 hypothetical protein BX659_1543 [Orenia metallireducens]SNY47566.1 hypothetical protein SAMN06265827_1543 [Orenia metallireducens]
MSEEKFEYEGFFGKIKAKGKGALVLSCSGAVLLAGGGIYLATKNKEALKKGSELATKGFKLIKNKDS